MSLDDTDIQINRDLTGTISPPLIMKLRTYINTFCLPNLSSGAKYVSPPDLDYDMVLRIIGPDNTGSVVPAVSPRPRNRLGLLDAIKSSSLRSKIMINSQYNEPVGNTIGSGAHGTVYRHPTDPNRCIKIQHFGTIVRSTIREYDTDSIFYRKNKNFLILLDRGLLEAIVMDTISHPAIPEVYSYRVFNEGTVFLSVLEMEYKPNLVRFINNTANKPIIIALIRLLKELYSVYEFTHNDVNLDNVLVNPRGELALIDFANSAFRWNGKTVISSHSLNNTVETINREYPSIKPRIIDDIVLEFRKNIDMCKIVAYYLGQYNPVSLSAKPRPTTIREDTLKQHVADYFKQKHMLPEHLRTLNISLWDVSHIEDFKEVFRYIRNNELETLDLNNWDMSNATTIEGIFSQSSFNGRIDKWNTSRIKNMKAAFAICPFNGDISGWDTSAVENMSMMFSGNRSFNRPIVSWRTDNVVNMASMFANTVFNQPLASADGAWNVSRVEDFSSMFSDCKFNQPLDWDVGAGIRFNGMFSSSIYNHPLNGWNMSKAEHVAYMFAYSQYNHPLDKWDLSRVRDMSHMFHGTTVFNQPIGRWSLGNVVDMSYCFYGSTYNKPLEDWDVSSVVDMSYMFFNSAYNQPLAAWRPSSLRKAEYMFADSIFNQPIENWDVSALEDASYMFHNCYFNQPLASWKPSRLKTANGMFCDNRKFNQPIEDWDTSSLEIIDNMFSGNSVFNQPLNNWDTSHLRSAFGTFSDNTKFNQPLDKWNTRSLEVTKDMFLRAKSFNQSIISWDLRKCADMERMFYGASAFNQSFVGAKLNKKANIKEIFEGSGMSPDNIQSFIDSYNQMRIDKGDIAPLKTQPLKTEYEYVHRQYIRYPDRTLKPIKKLIADKCIISDGLVVSSPPELTYDVVINIFTKLLDPNYGASTFPFITKTTMTGGADTLLDNIINGVPILPLLISTNLPFNGAFKPASQSIYNYKEFTIRMDKLNVDDLTESELYEREGDIITIKEDRLLDAIVMTSYGGDIMPELVSFSYSRYNGAWYAFTVIRKLGTDLEHISAQDILSQPIDGLIEVLKWLRDAWTSSGFIHNRLTAMNIIVSRDNVLLQDFSHSQFNFKSLIIRGIKTPSSGNNDLCTFLLTLFTPEYFNQATEYKTPVFEALEHYVEKPNITQLERQAIYEYIRNAEPMTIRVYRGQMSKELEDSDWYSTSIRRSVGEHFSSMPTSTLFIINVVNVPAIDVNEVLLSEGGWLNDRYDTEDEILVLGGGDFYSNADMTMRGMTKVDERTYETWYTMAGDNMESMSKKMRLRHSSLKNQ